MKKIWIFILSAFCFLFVSTISVKATTYSGKLGVEYLPSSTRFYYLTHNENVDKVYIHLDGAKSEMAADPSGAYVTTANGDQNGKEYYYEICYTDTTCVNTLDPYSKWLNLAKDANVVLNDADLLIDGWGSVTTIKSSSTKNAIYAVDAEQFTRNIPVQHTIAKDLDSVFEKMVIRTTLSDVNIGYAYLENAGYNYLEIGNLYDSDNYFYPNVAWSSMDDVKDPVKELRELVAGYKSIKMNVILRTNFITPSDTLKNKLLKIDSSYISDGKLNLNNEEIRRYIKDVYKYWVEYYKVDGFYIMDASLYGQDFLNELMNEVNDLDENKPVVFYSDSKDITSLYVSDELQNSLFGSLANTLSEGVINGVYGEEAINRVINAMFNGYKDDFSNYSKANLIINNFGSLNDLDLYSKLMIINGIGTREEIITNKIRLAFYTLYSAVGTPRVVAGNEFQNATPIATSDIATTPDEKMSCNSSKSLCYAKGDLKNISWEYLVRNGSESIYATNYRARYEYQYPSQTVFSQAKSIEVNNNYADKGVLYFVINYNASSNGDKERSIYIVNYSDKNITLDQISSKDYSKAYSLVGNITREKNTAIISAYSLFTFTEIRNKRLPNWVYIIIAAVLIILIFGIRAILITLLKKNKGIDYRATVKAERKTRKENKKKGIKEPKVRENLFETYVLSDPFIEEQAKARKEKREQKKNAKKVQEEDKVEEATPQETKENQSEEESK